MINSAWLVSGLQIFVKRMQIYICFSLGGLFGPAFKDKGQFSTKQLEKYVNIYIFMNAALLSSIITAISKIC